MLVAVWWRANRYSKDGRVGAFSLIGHQTIRVDKNKPCP